MWPSREDFVAAAAGEGATSVAARLGLVGVAEGFGLGFEGGWGWAVGGLGFIVLGWVLEVLGWVRLKLF